MSEETMFCYWKNNFNILIDSKNVPILSEACFKIRRIPNSPDIEFHFYDYEDNSVYHEINKLYRTNICFMDIECKGLHKSEIISLRGKLAELNPVIDFDKSSNLNRYIKLVMVNALVSSRRT